MHKVATTDATYKYQLGFRSEGQKEFVAAFYPTVADSKSLGIFLNKEPCFTKASPEQLARVTEFHLSTASVDDGFKNQELANRITALFTNLTTVSILVPRDEYLLGPLVGFISTLADKGIMVSHKVWQHGAISAE